jgi:alkylation response protein AidB-like acyl-CoA dehydrogenase
MIQFSTSGWTELADELGATFAERAAKHDETDAFVADNYVELKARKVLAAGVPKELGGGSGGASVADLAGFLRTLAHHCVSTALALSMHTHLVATAAWRWRNQKAPVDGLLKRVVAEDLVLCHRRRQLAARFREDRESRRRLSRQRAQDLLQRRPCRGAHVDDGDRG